MGIRYSSRLAETRRSAYSAKVGEGFGQAPLTGWLQAMLVMVWKMMSVPASLAVPDVQLTLAVKRDSAPLKAMFCARNWR
jgi:hypothetical protein